MKIETKVLLNAISLAYGYDFTNYAQASLIRRLNLFCKDYMFANISDIIPAILHDKKLMGEFVKTISVTVTEMFRDPFVFKSIREKIVPVLKTFPFVKIWVAGCATGEEAYSLAILLHEEGFLKKTHIYATDINSDSLSHAAAGIYDSEKLKIFESNYKLSGGKENFSDYFSTDYNSLLIKDFLKSHITFTKHNLVSDGPIGETNLILCRNVLIYFNKSLQAKVLSLFDASLCHNGFICLGSKETIDFSNIKSSYDVSDRQSKVYHKRFLREKRA